MQEAFLHFIWQYQYFDKNDLFTTDGQTIEVFNQGFLQSNAGPDFSQARVKINDIEWSGHVEIHVKSSAWYQHHHQKDASYDNVILHVVWEDDKEVLHQDQTKVPVLELKNRVDLTLINKYKKLINQPESIPCSSQWNDVDELTRISMWDKALMSRLERKSSDVLEVLDRTGNDWEETAYRMLMKNFGFKLNSEVFERLAEKLPHKLILKHGSNLMQVEALLFGQAGFLEEEKDEYQAKLKKEYEFLAKKYSLYDHRLHASQWKFMRLRPANFPTLRIAQVAAILVSLKHVFDKLTSINTFKELNSELKQDVSSYWQSHYRFGIQAERKSNGIGKSSSENIIINTVIPVLAAYGKTYDQSIFLDRSVSFLQEIPAENNVITRKWQALGQANSSSFDSQASIELYNEYCKKRKCLSCNIGVKLIANRSSL